MSKRTSNNDVLTMSSFMYPV